MAVTQSVLLRLVVAATVVGVVFGAIGECRSRPVAFDVTQWQSGGEGMRYRMALHGTFSSTVAGLSPEEVLRVLGNPQGKHHTFGGATNKNNETWTYLCYAGFPWRTRYIELTFRENSVSDINITEPTPD
ncbi:MAG: hypothetical protein EDM79_21665 [Chloroflexi bacterium]|nr:MAG: hypothetical protein EDM79_21665 [Chloroflexota bacterium]